MKKKGKIKKLVKEWENTINRPMLIEKFGKKPIITEKLIDDKIFDEVEKDINERKFDLVKKYVYTYKGDPCYVFKEKIKEQPRMFAIFDNGTSLILPYNNKDLRVGRYGRGKENK